MVAAASMAGEDQFLASPDLRETLTDAGVLNEGAFGKLTSALMGENERADDLIRMIGAYLWSSRRRSVTARVQPASP